VLGYQRSIRGSFEIQNECIRLENEISRTEALIEELPILKKKYQNSRTIDQKNLSMQLSVMGLIANSVNENKVSLASFDALHSYQENNLMIKTQGFTLKGNFKNSLTLIDKIEKQFDLSRVSSLDFYTEKNYNTGKKELYAKVYLQKITRP
jgi:hypothetical protein